MTKVHLQSTGTAQGLFAHPLPSHTARFMLKIVRPATSWHRKVENDIFQLQMRTEKFALRLCCGLGRKQYFVRLKRGSRPETAYRVGRDLPCHRLSPLSTLSGAELASGTSTRGILRRRAP